MRVIAGQARGARLHVPKGLDIRPTLDRVREALFSILMPRLAGARFLDLFAGSGANGIEALSRGAAWCGFVDQSPRALAAVTRNLDSTALAPRADTFRFALPEGLATLARRVAPCDIIFADPPFGYDACGPLLASIEATGLLAEGGEEVLEHAARQEGVEEAGALRRVRHSRYGKVTLSFFS